MVLMEVISHGGKRGWRVPVINCVLFESRWCCRSDFVVLSDKIMCQEQCLCKRWERDEAEEASKGQSVKDLISHTGTLTGSRWETTGEIQAEK